MDSLVSSELLVSLFLPESLNKAHDGAVVIRDLRITRAGMFFPMPESKVADPNFGSRHRAALGITEETDAVVVVVSEERGTITLCFQGSYVASIDGANLRKILLEQLGHRTKGEKEAAEPSASRLGAAHEEDDRAGAGPATPRVPTSEAAAAGSDRSKPAVVNPVSARPPASTPAPPSAVRAAATQSGKPPAQSADATGRSAALPAQSTAAALLVATSTPAGSPAAAAARRVSRPMATPTPPLVAVELDAGDPALTPTTSRVSRPMPVAKERRPLSDRHVELSPGRSAPAPGGDPGRDPDPSELLEGPNPPVGDEP
jgi:diadenylate cyclase